MNKLDGILISVIIPVFNVQEYVEECVKSVLDQSYQNIEIIIINDGSTDASSDICKRIANMDSRIRLIEQKNIGLGETRNRGIELAKGDYIAFVDSDDYIHTDFLKILLNKAEETGADIIEGEYEVLKDGFKKLNYSFKNTSPFFLDDNNKELFYKFYYFGSIYKHFAWDKLYKKEFLIRNNIRFGDNRIIFAEDTWFQLQALYYNPRIDFATGAIYVYRQRLESIMHQPKKNLPQRQYRMAKYYETFINDKNESRIEDRVLLLVAYEALIMEAMNQIHFDGTYKNFKQKIKFLLEDDAYTKWMKDIWKKKGYLLEPKRGRRWFLLLFGLLYNLNLSSVSVLLLWLIYKIKE